MYDPFDPPKTFAAWQEYTDAQGKRHRQLVANSDGRVLRDEPVPSVYYSPGTIASPPLNLDPSSPGWSGAYVHIPPPPTQPEPSDDFDGLDALPLASIAEVDRQIAAAKQHTSSVPSPTPTQEAFSMRRIFRVLLALAMTIIGGVLTHYGEQAYDTLTRTVGPASPNGAALVTSMKWDTDWRTLGEDGVVNDRIGARISKNAFGRVVVVDAKSGKDFPGLTSDDLSRIKWVLPTAYTLAEQRETADRVKVLHEPNPARKEPRTEVARD